jgi:hypothetical protein
LDLRRDFNSPFSIVGVLSDAFSQGGLGTVSWLDSHEVIESVDVFFEAVSSASSSDMPAVEDPSIVPLESFGM